MRRQLLRGVRVLIWFIGVTLLLLVAIFLVIRIPAVQSAIVKKVATQIQSRIHPDASIGKVLMNLPKTVVLEDIYLPDNEGDTLLSIHRLSVSLNLSQLIQKHIELTQISCEKLTANVTKREGVFNFQYILDSLASDTTDTADTTSTGWNVTLQGIRLNDARLHYSDSLVAISTLAIRELDLDGDVLDPVNGVYHLGAIKLDGTVATIDLPLANDENNISSDSASTNWPDVSLSSLNILDSRFQYGTAQTSGLTIIVGKLRGVFESVDLKEGVIAIESLASINNQMVYETQTDSAVENHTKADTLKKITSPLSSMGHWKVKVNVLELQQNSVSIGSDSSLRSFEKISLTAKDISIDSTKLAAIVSQGSVEDNQGPDLKALSFDAKFSGQKTEVKDLKLIYGNSKLSGNVTLNYRSFESIANPRELRGSVDLEGSLQPDELMAMTPVNADLDEIELPNEIIIAVRVTAKDNNLLLETLQLSALDSTRLNITGEWKDFTEDQGSFNISLNRFETSLANLHHLLPATLFPDRLTLPDHFLLNGRLTGTAQRPSLTLNLSTNLGRIEMKGIVDRSNETYVADARLHKVNIGKIVAQPDINTLSSIIHIQGKGFNIDHIKAKARVDIQELIFHSYHYRDIALTGAIDNKRIKLEGRSRTDDLNAVVTAEIDQSDSIAGYQLNLGLENAALHNLHLTRQPYFIKGDLKVDIQTPDFRSLNGSIRLSDFGVYNGKELYLIDSMLVASIDEKGRSELSIDSDVLEADFRGTFNILAVPGVLSDYFKHHLSSSRLPDGDDTTQQAFTFKGTLKTNRLLTEVLFPGLESFRPVVIEGKFDSQESSLDIKADIPRIQYGAVTVASGDLRIVGNEQGINYSSSIHQISVDTLSIYEFTADGRIADDTIRNRLAIKDSLGEKRYLLKEAIVVTNGVHLQLSPDSVILNYQPWTVPIDNSITTGNNTFIAHNFSLTKGNEKMAIEGNTKESPLLTLHFNNLELGNFTKIIDGVVPIAGELNGQFQYALGKSPHFSSEATVAGLTIMRYPLGDLRIRVDGSGDRTSIDGFLRGNRTSVTTSVVLSTGNDATMNVNIEQLNMAVVSALSFGYAHHGEGIVQGKVKMLNSRIDATLNFKDASIIPTMLGTRLTMADESVSISNNQLKFDRFRISDESGNITQIKGSIDFARITDPSIDLTVKAKNFQLMNTSAPEKNSQQSFYGRVDINADAQISGTFSRPKIDTDLSLGPESRITYVLPTSTGEVTDTKGIVNFVDRDAAEDPFLSQIKPTVTTGSSIEVDLTASMKVSDKETLTIVIDPITGDQLTIRGNADLTLGMTPAGDVNLAGRYEITSGFYQFSFHNLVKRKFDIIKGSSLTWTGDATNPTSDIRASNRIETSPAELIANQSTTSSLTSGERLPFLVYLKITGAIQSPTIAFELDMPPDKRNAYGGMIYSRLQDINTRESDLNKQVFALLILKRFIADNPLENQGGIANTARTSVSRILTDQINRLSGNIKGVQLSVDIKSYQNNTGSDSKGKTSAQLGVSKSLLNDRLVVKVAGNVDLEGQQRQQNNASDYIGDLALEYKLTKDGRLRITGFRNSNYDMIDGELIETGAGLIYIKDYNTLLELFKANDTP